MATLIAYADDNLTGSTTFKAAETGTSALAMIRANTTTLASNTSVSSPSFTITNTDVVEGVLLWLMATAAAPAGTLLVELQLGGVTQSSVTVNCADLPHSATATNDVLSVVPIFFKFTATHTSSGGATYTIKLTTSNNSSATITYSRNSATTGDFTKALRTSATATPAAGDDLYIIGELTGAGTHNSRAVTMNSTATTAYGNGVVNSTSVNGGGVRVSCFGTLTYGTAASTNYVLRVNGDVEVFWNGTLNIGSSGAEIPRTSTAVLEIQQASADGDFGLIGRNLSTVNIAGLSRTSGKNVVQCKLTSDVASSSIGSLFNGTQVTTSVTGGLNASGTSLLGTGVIDTVTNTSHYATLNGATTVNITYTAVIWLARGSGTNNRFVRFGMFNNSAFPSATNGFYSDIDLQAGTAGTVTALGTGTATSVSIAALGAGFLIKITGKVQATSTAVYSHAVACSAAGTTSYAGGANQCFIYDHWAIVPASSISDTTFNVDTDTGWLSGDIVCVASTTRTITDCEDFPLNANAGASSFVTSLYPFGANGVLSSTHSGTSPTQAEVGLLTRNVKIRSTSSTLMAYVYAELRASFTFTWAEFYYLGTGTTKKRGIELDGGAAVTAKSITFCAIHDGETNGLYLNANGVASANVTFSNNVIWNTASSGINVAGLVSLGDWIISSNLVMKVTSTAGVILNDITGTFTNNAIVASGSNGITVNSSGTFGSFSGNVVHSNASQGMTFNASSIFGLMTAFSSWRNSAFGLGLLGVLSDGLVLDNITLFGNGTTNLVPSSVSHLKMTGTNVIASDATFSTTNGISWSSSANCALDIINLDMSGTGTGLAAHTNDLAVGAVCTLTGVVNNSKFGTATPITNKAANFTVNSYVSFEKYGQTAGDHRTEMKYGQLKTDSTFFNTASPSMRMTPNSASSKVESAPRGMGWKVPVSSGNTAAIAVYIYKSKTGDGAAYNGNQPRLIQRANAALGQTSDVVLATYSSSTGSWNQLSANTSTATDDGAWEIIVDCDGTAGWINVDDLQVA